jgi:hypothetical protein
MGRGIAFLLASLITIDLLPPYHRPMKVRAVLDICCVAGLSLAGLLL